MKTAETAGNAGFSRHAGRRPAKRVEPQVRKTQRLATPTCGSSATAWSAGLRPARGPQGRRRRVAVCPDGTPGQACALCSGRLRRRGPSRRSASRRARCGAPRVPVGDRRSKPYVPPSCLSSAPRWEPFSACGCAVRGAEHRACRLKPALQAGGAIRALGRPTGLHFHANWPRPPAEHGITRVDFEGCNQPSDATRAVGPASCPPGTPRTARSGFRASPAAHPPGTAAAPRPPGSPPGRPAAP